MRLSSILKGIFLLAVIAVTANGCKNRAGEFPFNADSASAHIRPYKVLKGYIDSFQAEKTRLYSLVNDTAYINNNFNLANAELFNRDAILALLNAKGAAGIRIYFGKKTTGDSTNGNIVLVLLPVDAKGNDIKTKLVVNDGRTGLRIPGIPSAQAAPDPAGAGAEGVEDGQRCPTMCSEQTPL